MNIKITMAVIATAFALTACGNIKNDIPGRETTPGGTLTAAEAGEKGFERIETYGKFNVFFVQGDKTSRLASAELASMAQATSNLKATCVHTASTFPFRGRAMLSCAASIAANAMSQWLAVATSALTALLRRSLS